MASIAPLRRRISPLTSRKQGNLVVRRRRRSEDFSPPAGRALRTLQPKFKLGAPNDPLELEADRVADQVAYSPAFSGGPAPVSREAPAPTLRRTPESPFSISEEGLVEDEGETLMTQAKGHAHAPAVPATAVARVEAARKGGGPLPEPTRSFMEQRFGRSFDRVRVHHDARAAEAADSVDARAFTLGEHIVFGRGQFAPETRDGRWLLAHELTHFVQQGHARPSKRSASKPAVSNESTEPTLRRVRWHTAQDTGRDSSPWGSGPKGDVYQVQTDAGTRIDAWRPHNGSTYWCHGFTFGGWQAANGPFSIWGQDVPTVLKDEGWHRTESCLASKRDVLVFRGQNVTHSGVVASASSPNAIINERRSMLDSKWGSGAQNVSSWHKNAVQYGVYNVYSKTPLAGPCQGRGAHER